MGVLYILLKDLYHLHEMGFEVRILLFSCVRLSRTCCGRRAGICWCQIALASVNYVLAHAFNNLVVPVSSRLLVLFALGMSSIHATPPRCRVRHNCALRNGVLFQVYR